MVTNYRSFLLISRGLVLVINEMKSSTAESINLYCKLKKTQEKWWGERGREKTYPNVSASNKKSEMFSLNDPAGSF